MGGSVDELRGLKENVIIGRLIPARLDKSDEGYEKLGFGKLVNLDNFDDEGALRLLKKMLDQMMIQLLILKKAKKVIQKIHLKTKTKLVMGD